MGFHNVPNILPNSAYSRSGWVLRNEVVLALRVIGLKKGNYTKRYYRCSISAYTVLEYIIIKYF